jgi:solute carrier family 25 carnitine/acylcarnitine transporter 20/29
VSSNAQNEQALLVGVDFGGDHDVCSIKSKLQTDSLIKGERAFTGIIDCARKTWAKQGFKGFTNGLAPTLIRSPFGELGPRVVASE